MSSTDSTSHAPGLSRPTCHDCGAEEGQFHDHFPLCDQEQCPICLEQLLSCPHQTKPQAVRRKGRIRFVLFPILCARCGVQWPEFFSAPTPTWERVVPRTHWNTVICRPCFDYLETLAPPPPQRKPRAVPADDSTLSLL